MKIAISTKTNPTQSQQQQLVNIPDDWLWYISSRRIPAIRKQEGFYHLSRKGWAANKEAIKEVYLNATPPFNKPKQPWSDYERHMDNFFEEIEKNTAKKIDQLESDAEFLKNAL